MDAAYNRIATLRRRESPRAFTAFKHYLETEPVEARSLRRTASFTGEPLALVERWAERYEWKERARGRDEYLDDVRAGIEE